MLHLLQYIRDGEFKKFDYKSVEKNKKAYGQADPTKYDLKAVKGYNISLMCGSHDLLVAPDDYNWLHEELIENGNDVNFFEYKLGHQGLLFPKEENSANEIVDQIVQDYDIDCYYKYSKESFKIIHKIGDFKFWINFLRNRMYINFFWIKYELNQKS